MVKIRLESFLVAAVGVSAGCGTHVDRTLKVDRVAVRDEFDGTWTEDLELEVHMFDVDSAEFLGCSRGPKNHEGRFHKAAAAFERRGEWLTDLDVRDRSLVLIVVENDDDPCPNLYTYGEDELPGVSGEISGLELASGMSLAFDRVVALDVEGL